MTESGSASPKGAPVDTGRGAQKTIKEGIINGFQIINQVEAGLVDLARNTIADTIKATGTVANEAVSVTSEVVKGTIAAAQEAGSGLLDGDQKHSKGDHYRCERGRR